MKTKALLLLLVGILATTGSTCIQDGFLVSVNVPIKATLSNQSRVRKAWTSYRSRRPIK